MKLGCDLLVIIALELLLSSVVWAASSNTITPGTVINMQNWRPYQQLDGMSSLPELFIESFPTISKSDRALPTGLEGTR
jgi:hypothetical protein